MHYVFMSYNMKPHFLEFMYLEREDWKSQTPKNWKRNSLLSTLHHAKRISSNYPRKVLSIKNTFLNAGYPYKFVMNTIWSPLLGVIK